MHYELCIKRIGLFGGTFDPIHYAHVKLALSIKLQHKLDEVWFMVTPLNPWKQGSTLSPDHHRFNMVQLAVSEHDGLVASDYEFHLEKPTYSYLTLRHLREDFPQHEFTLIVGGDNWAQFDHWAHFDEILLHHPVVVYPREGCDIATPEAVSMIPHRLTVVNAETMPVSSTQIRSLCREGKSLSGLVCSAVEQYIHDNNLYK